MDHNNNLVGFNDNDDNNDNHNNNNNNNNNNANNDNGNNNVSGNEDQKATPNSKQANQVTDNAAPDLPMVQPPLIPKPRFAPAHQGRRAGSRVARRLFALTPPPAPKKPKRPRTDNDDDDDQHRPPVPASRKRLF